MHGHRLSRQFQKSLDTLRDIQADRAERERRDLKRAAALQQMHKHKGIPYDPKQDGFDFSIDQVEACAERLMRRNQSRQFECVLFNMPPPARATSV